MCRRHFDSDCFNGGCRRLLNTAVPTLYLKPSAESEQLLEESNNLITTVEKNILYVPVAADDREEHFELVLTENKIIVDTNDVKGES